MFQRRTILSRLFEGGGSDPVGSLPKLGPIRFSAQCRQYIACGIATVTMFIVGTVYGWTTTFLLPLTSGTDNVPLTLSRDEYSWVVSLTVLGSIIGSVVGAQVADHNGRKYCLVVCSGIFTVGWFIIYATASVRMLYFARVIHGVGVGIAHTINPMYVSEVADVNYRGVLAILIVVNVYYGSLITCSLGLWLTYKSLLGTFVIISFISFLSNMCFPETPYFLVAKGRDKQACKSIAFYKEIVDSEKMTIELRALRAQTTYELHPQSRYELHQQSRTDLPSQSRTDLPSQSRTDLPPQSRPDLPSHSRTDLPSQSRSNLPPQSIHERFSDPIQKVNTESASDLHLPSSSDSPSISVIHSEVVCDVHQPPTVELRLQASRDSHESPLQPLHALHSQSASQIHRPSTSEIQLPSTSEIQLPSTSEIRRRSTSEIRRRSTSEIRRPSTSELPLQPSRAIHSQSASELYRPSTSEIQRPSTSEIQGPSTREIQRPSTSEIQGPSTREIQRPSTSEIQGPSTRVIQGPSTSEIHPSSSSQIYIPWTNEIQRPSTSEIQGPSTSEIQRPTTSEIQGPSTSEIHPSSSSQIYIPWTNEIQRPSTSEIQGPSTIEIQRPITSEIQGPSTSEIHPSSSSQIYIPWKNELYIPWTRQIYRPSTSEMNPDLICEIQSRSNSDSRTPSRIDSRTRSNVDSRVAPDMDGTKYTWLTKLQVILQRSNKKALFIILGLIMAQQLSGNFITTQYMEMLFNKTTIGVNPNEATILAQLVILLSGGLAISIVDWVGRRTLLILSTIGSCITMIILAYYLLLAEYYHEVPKFDIFPAIDLIIYQAMFQIGLGTIPKLLICELFPTELRGFVGAITVIFDGIIGFIVSKLYQAITDNVGSYAVYFIFGISCLLAFVMVYIWVPETKGKTYHEIEALLVGNNVNSSKKDVRIDRRDIHTL